MKREDPWAVIRSWRHCLQEWDLCSYKRRQRDPSPLLQCEVPVIRRPSVRKWALTRYQIWYLFVSALLWDFPTSRAIRKEFLVFISHQICGIVLLQPKCTKTPCHGTGHTWCFNHCYQQPPDLSCLLPFNCPDTCMGWTQLSIFSCAGTYGQLEKRTWLRIFDTDIIHHQHQLGSSQ